MDPFFSPPTPLLEELMHGDMLLWDFSPEPYDPTATATLPEEQPVAAPHSAFVRYVESDRSSSQVGGEVGGEGKRNIHQRVVELLRRISRDGPGASSDGGSSRGFRHMMRERQRRERLSQSYADLHSMLPYGSKPDKNSIVQSAAVYVRELKRAREELVARNNELKARATAATARSMSSPVGTEKVRIQVTASPSSAIDSMIGALWRLKAMDARAMAIQAEVSGHELNAVLTVESKVAGYEVERVLVASWT